MLIKDLCKMQKELDDYILENHNLQEVKKEDLLSKRFLAFMVEFGEFLDASEEEKLTEFIDGVHFLLSLKNELDVFLNYEGVELKDVLEILENDIKKSEDALIRDVIHAFWELANKNKAFKYWSVKPMILGEELNKEYSILLLNYLTLGVFHGYTFTDIENAYVQKYNENVQRQKSNY